MSFDQILYQKGAIYIVPETNYAGGPAGLARSKTKIETTDTPISLLPFKEGSNISLPIRLYERGKNKGIFVSKYGKFRYIEKVECVQGETEHYVNTIEMSLLKGGMLNEGDLPNKSWVIHFDDGKTRYEVYGCFVESVTLNIPEHDAPDLKITWRSYDHRSDANDLSDLEYSFNDNQPLLREDVYLSINGIYVPFKSITFTLKNLLNENYYPTPPSKGHEFWIQENELELEITTIFPTTSQFNALLSTNINKVPIIITLGSFGSISITNVEVYVENPKNIGAMKAEFREVNLKCGVTADTQLTIT